MSGIDEDELKYVQQMMEDPLIERLIEDRIFEKMICLQCKPGNERDDSIIVNRYQPTPKPPRLFYHIRMYDEYTIMLFGYDLPTVCYRFDTKENAEMVFKSWSSIAERHLPFPEGIMNCMKVSIKKPNDFIGKIFTVTNMSNYTLDCTKLETNGDRKDILTTLFREIGLNRCEINGDIEKWEYPSTGSYILI